MRLADVIAAHVKDTPTVGTKTLVHGLPVTIEHAKGTVRKLHDDSGNLVYSQHLFHSYGYFDKTKGRDGDEVDCFLGPVKDAQEVYIVHMLDKGPVENEREDEDKCFAGFPSADAAKTAFLLHYPDTFYGGMTALPVDVFKQKLATAQLPYRQKKISGGGPGSGPHPGYSTKPVEPRSGAIHYFDKISVPERHEVSHNGETVGYIEKKSSMIRQKTGSRTASDTGRFNRQWDAKDTKGNSVSNRLKLGNKKDAMDELVKWHKGQTT